MYEGRGEGMVAGWVSYNGCGKICAGAGPDAKDREDCSQSHTGGSGREGRDGGMGFEKWEQEVGVGM